MFADPSTPSLLPALTSGLLGLAGTTATIIFSWLKDWREDADRDKWVETATKQITFWSDWLKVQNDVTDNDGLIKAKQLVLLKTASISTTLTNHLEFIDSSKQLRPQISAGRQFFFFYRPPHALGYLPRFFFWLTSAFGIYIDFNFIYDISMLDSHDAATMYINYRALTRFNLYLFAILLSLGILTLILDRSMAAKLRTSEKRVPVLKRSIEA